MTEQEKNANEAQSGEGTVDLTKYVGKEDYDKALSAKEAEVSKVKEELEQAKMSLLDPEYIDYLESKKEKPAERDAANEAGLPTKTEFDALKKELGMTKAAVQDVLAVIELKNTEEKYADFKDYKDDVKAILESSRAPLTFEQAYLIAKSQKPKEPAKSADPKQAPAYEKPSGSVPGSDLDKKDFKDADEASSDAWDKVVGPGKDRI
jgi:superfamily II DNA or RNA helicase